MRIESCNFFKLIAITLNYKKAVKSLYTVCWNCIHEKITEDGWQYCPICSTEFGPEPLKKLRHDDPILLSLEKNDNEEEDVETDESSEEDTETESSDSEDMDTDE